VTSEIREVNIGFNRMAQQLAKIEQDRAVMLAGISHDLRTPLARLRLETEMSVSDQDARDHMAADIDQLDAIIDKFWTTPGRTMIDAQAGAAGRRGRAPACTPCRTTGDMRITDGRVRKDLYVLADEVELARVLSNLLENARRYGKTPETGVAVVDISAKARTRMGAAEGARPRHGRAARALANLTKPSSAATPPAPRPPAPAWAWPSWTRPCSAWAASLRWPTPPRAAWRRTSSCKNPSRQALPRQRRSSTTARASMLRPCPTGPSFSAVLAFTLTCSSPCRAPWRCAARMAGCAGPGGRLGDHGAVDVADRQPAAARGARPRQQHRPSRRPETLVRVRKMRADVAQPAAPSSASVMACSSTSASEWPSRPGRTECHAADDQLAPRHQRVHVPAFADADDSHSRGVLRLLSTASASAKVLGVGDLEVLRAAGTSSGWWPSASMALDSSVTALARLAPAPACSSADAEHLRRLRQPLVAAVHRGPPRARPASS
jgi:hypothetical protein